MPQTNLSILLKLFSIAFEPPTIPWVEPIISGSLADSMKAVWEALDLPQQAIDAYCESLRFYIGRDDDEVMHELRREFTRLFLGGEPPVSNTEGIWRMKAEGRQAALIINTYSLEVADFMRQCGIVKAQSYNDCIDYIETECDFAAFLASKPEYLISLGKDPIVLLETFVDEHMKLWIPGFCAEVSKASEVIYYKALSALMDGFMKEL